MATLGNQSPENTPSPACFEREQLRADQTFATSFEHRYVSRCSKGVDATLQLRLTKAQADPVPVNDPHTARTCPIIELPQD